MVNRAAMKIGVQVSFQISVLASFFPSFKDDIWEGGGETSEWDIVGGCGEGPGRVSRLWRPLWTMKIPNRIVPQ